MTNFVSINFKYYENSNKSEIAHVSRKFKEDKNVLDKNLTKDNFGSKFDIEERYEELLEFAKANTKEKTGRAFQTKNTFLDGVLAFSKEQMFELKQDPDWKEKMSALVEQYMLDVQSKTGFMPVGWAFHLDEGKYDENGQIELNHHAHLLFMNHDEKTGKAPLREFQKRKSDSIWSELQTLAGARFNDMGFVRGISKEVTQRRHKEKDEYVSEVLMHNEKLQAELSAALAVAQESVSNVQSAMSQIKAVQAKMSNESYDSEAFEDQFNKLRGPVQQIAEKYAASYKARGFAYTVAQAFKKVSPSGYEYVARTSERLLKFFKGSIPKLDVEMINEIEYKTKQINKKIEEQKKELDRINKKTNKVKRKI